MNISFTIAGNLPEDITIPAGMSLRAILTDKLSETAGTSVSVNGRTINDESISTYTLNDGDAVFVSRTTKLGV